MLFYLRYFYLIPREVQKIIFTLFYKLLFKINGVKFGTNCRVYNAINLLIHKGATVFIGDNYKHVSGGFNPLVRNVKGSIYVARNGTLVIGNNVGMSSVIVWVADSITIGNNVKIGGDSMLIDTDAHSLDYKKRRNPLLDVAKTGPIIIEDDVLIGTRCVIMKGVTIGARSIIGAGSIVTKSIPSDCIAAGNPCRVIKYNVNSTNSR